VDVFTRDNRNPSTIIVLATGKFDGPQMSEQDHPLFHQGEGRFQFNGGVIKGKRIGARVTSRAAEGRLNGSGALSSKRSHLA
jgi:hypothetical protein